MVQATIEKINKEKALEYLACNMSNYRGLSKNRVKLYAEDMKSGNWELNGEPIVFDESGLLKNGQHRLNAIVLADVEVDMMVVRGVSDSVTIYDSGFSRDIRQILRAEGYSFNGLQVSVARIVVFGFHASSAKAVLKNYIEDHEEELRRVDNIISTGNKKGAGHTVGAGVFVYVSRRLNLYSDDLMKEFFWCMNNMNIKPDMFRNPSPALVASRMFLSQHYSSRTNVQIEQINILYQAMNDFKNNKSRTKIYTPNAVDFMPMINQVRKMDGLKETNI